MVCQFFGEVQMGANTRVFIPVKPLSRHAKGYRDEYPKFVERIRKFLRLYRRGGKLYLKVTFHFRGVCDVDMDNYLVPLMNALEGCWYHNDKQVKWLKTEIVEYHHKYGIFLEIGRLP